MDLVTQPELKPYSAPYAWRLVATALSFTLFGIGGVLLRILVFPLLALLPGTRLQPSASGRGLGWAAAASGASGGLGGAGVWGVHVGWCRCWALHCLSVACAVCGPWCFSRQR